MSVNDFPNVTVLTGYNVGREIGAGSFARVYMGQTTNTEPLKTVAVKSVTLQKLSQKLLDNLESEISILKGIRHPHIVSLIDIINTESHIHLIMEYCPLGDLSFFIRRRERLLKAGQIPAHYPNNPGAGLHETLVRHFLIQLTSALEFLRSQNLMHRDVKPQNLLLLPPVDAASLDHQEKGVHDLPILKLADFGFARYLQSAALAETLCGSPLYMAPEILRYEKYDASADLWSLGTVLYEMLVGKPPFKANGLKELLDMIDKGDDRIKFPRDVILNEEMKDLARALLKRNPRDRITYSALFSHPVLQSQHLTEMNNSTLDSLHITESPLILSSRARGDIRQPGTTPSAGLRQNSAGDAEMITIAPAFITDLIPVNTPPTPFERPSPSVTNVASAQRARVSVQEANAPTQSHGTLSTGTAVRPNVPPGFHAYSRPDQLHRAVSESDSARSTGSQSPRTSNTRSPKPRDKDKESESEYVLVEKKAVEVNAFADAMAQSPHTGTLIRRQSMKVARTPSQNNVWSSGNPTKGLNANTVQTLAVAETRLGSSPASALAKALSIASQKLFGGGSPPAWLENMVHPSSSTRALSRTQSIGLWPTIDEIRSPGEEQLLQHMEAIAMKSNIVYNFAELKLHQLIPPPPSHSSDELESVLTSEAIVSLCEEAIVLYLKTLQLLQKNIDLVREWLAQEPAQGTTSRPNHVVQWTRQRYNEVLEKAEYLQQKKSTTLSCVAPDYQFEEVTAEKLLYDRALEISRGAAINEIVGENLSHCEEDYELSVMMLEAILETPAKSRLSTGVAEPLIEEEDRKMIEKWTNLTRARLEKLRNKLDSAGRFAR